MGVVSFLFQSLAADRHKNFAYRLVSAILRGFKLNPVSWLPIDIALDFQNGTTNKRISDKHILTVN